MNYVFLPEGGTSESDFPWFSASDACVFSSSETPQTLEEFFCTRPGMSLRDRLNVILVDQVQCWQKNRLLGADEYLQRFPELAADENILLDLVYNEIRLCRQIGLPLDANALTQRFPSIAERLFLQINLTEAISSGASLADLPPGAVSRYEAGHRFGPFELTQYIGGGSAQVYRARHCELDQEFAVKLLPVEYHGASEHRNRFETEIQIVTQFKHSAILPAIDSGITDDVPWFYSPMLEAGNLEQNLAQVQGDCQLVTRLMITLANGIQYIHDQGILHCDLKPSNILIDAQGNPLIADFGLAQRHDAPAVGQVEFAGTVLWMPPEFATGVQNRSTITGDVYGLGAILYFLLTGQPPHSGNSFPSVLEKIRTTEPPEPRSVNTSVDPTLEAICLKALHRSPGRRYASAREMSQDLEQSLHGQRVQAGR